MLSDIGFVRFMLVLGFLAGLSAGGMVANYMWQNQAIEQGCGQFNGKTGDFEWIQK